MLILLLIKELGEFHIDICSHNSLTTSADISLAINGLGVYACSLFQQAYTLSSLTISRLGAKGMQCRHSTTHRVEKIYIFVSYYGHRNQRNADRVGGGIQ